MKARLLVSAMLVLGCTTAVAAAPEDPNVLPNLFPFPNPSGVLRTFSTTGQLDMTGPFFQDLGTNGRTCVTCHQPGDAWSLSAANVEERFQASHGRDPL